MSCRKYSGREISEAFSRDCAVIKRGGEICASILKRAKLDAITSEGNYDRYCYLDGCE